MNYPFALLPFFIERRRPWVVTASVSEFFRVFSASAALPGLAPEVPDALVQEVEHGERGRKHAVVIQVLPPNTGSEMRINIVQKFGRKRIIFSLYFYLKNFHWTSASVNILW